MILWLQDSQGEVIYISLAIFLFSILHFSFYCYFSIDSILVLCNSFTNLLNELMILLKIPF